MNHESHDRAAASCSCSCFSCSCPLFLPLIRLAHRLLTPSWRPLVIPK